MRGREVGVATFDVWHTLIDLPPFAESDYMRRQWALGGESVAEAPEGPLAADVATAMDPWAAFRRAYEEAVAASREGATISPADQLRRAGELAGRRPKAAPYERRLERLVAETPFRPVRNARGMLEALRLAGYRMAVISNTVGEPGRFLQKILDKHGLAHSFDAYAWSDEHPWAKPSPQLFRFALDALRSDPSHAVHIGDGPSDILGAQGVGYHATILFEGSTEYAPEYRTLFAPTSGTPLSPTHRAKRLEEIPKLVDDALRARAKARRT
ncbi:MAG TPA: HAD family hydrolase [Thermoplasmata archaeon]|nr:HAD family hydrolase [Thermoplasmata archaeon]